MPDLLVRGGETRRKRDPRGSVATSIADGAARGVQEVACGRKRCRLNRVLLRLPQTFIHTIEKSFVLPDGPASSGAEIVALKGRRTVAAQQRCRRLKEVPGIQVVVPQIF